MLFFRSSNLVLSEFQGRGLRIASRLLLFPNPSCHCPTVPQNKLHEMCIVSSSHIIGFFLIWFFHYMPCLPSDHYITWPGSRLCSCWRSAWYNIFDWFPGIDSGWGSIQIGFRSRACVWSLGIQWGIGLSWLPGRWRMMLPSTVIDHFSDPQ